MIARDRSAAQGCEADRARHARAGDAVAPACAARGEIDAAPLGRRFALVLALIGFLATVALARFAKRRAPSGDAEGEDGS